MSVLRMHGRVRVPEAYPDDGGYVDEPDGPEIDGKPIVDAIQESGFQWKDKVTVAIADERFDGDLYASEGCHGYSEWTPGCAADLRCGNHDLTEVLERYEGQTITLWIADEPVNVLEDA